MGDFSVAGLVERWRTDFGEQSLDILVHSLANGPEVTKALLDTSRTGYLTAVSVSAYSLVALVARAGPLFRAGSSVLSLTYMASERVIPGYGGGMSSAKAALESDTRVLAFEAGRRWGVRVNTISAGPFASRAASAIGIIERDGANTAPPTHHSPSRSSQPMSPTWRRSSPARSAPASRAQRSTWTKGTTPWE